MEKATIIESDVRGKCCNACKNRKEIDGNISITGECIHCFESNFIKLLFQFDNSLEVINDDGKTVQLDNLNFNIPYWYDCVAVKTKREPLKRPLTNIPKIDVDHDKVKKIVDQINKELRGEI